MIDILNLTRAELTDFIVKDLGEKPFRAAQIWQWLWQRGAESFAEMTSVAKDLRARLAKRAVIRLPQIVAEAKSADGTVKLLLRLADGELIETVLIPGETRGGDTQEGETRESGETRMTQCLSCQVGCAMGCTFCSTGSMGFTRDMTQAEILGQVLVGRKYLGDTIRREVLRNLVFMGMGEPLMNFSELMRSLETLNSEQGLGFSRRRITVSTCGIEQGLLELGASNLAFLAVSLHAADQTLRERIMPAAARWPLEALLATLEKYPLAAREHLTFEYLLLGGLNDSPAQAAKLAAITNRLNAKVNLIAYNPAEGSPYRAPTAEEILAFEQELWRRGVTAILRKSKGKDIKAACGQLRAQAIVVSE